MTRRNTIAAAALLVILTVVGTVFAARSCVSSVSAPLLSQWQTEEAGYKSRIAALEKELQEKTASASAQIGGLRKQIEQLMQTADGLWKQASQQQQGDDAEQAETSFRSFVSKFPDDKRVPEARKRIAQLEKQRKQAELEAAKREKEEEMTARLSSVTMDQIVADTKTYRNKTFERTICCARPTERSMGGITASCYWVLNNNDPDLESHLVLDIPAALARRIPTEADKVDKGNCKYLLEATMRFTGVVAYGVPLMDLKKADFNVKTD